MNGEIFLAYAEQCLAPTLFASADCHTLARPVPVVEMNLTDYTDSMLADIGGFQHQFDLIHFSAQPRGCRSRICSVHARFTMHTAPHQDDEWMRVGCVVRARDDRSDCLRGSIKDVINEGITDVYAASLETLPEVVLEAFALDCKEGRRRAETRFALSRDDRRI
jgi:hypothetical protein